jgi:hypothetical protein
VVAITVVAGVDSTLLTLTGKFSISYLDIFNLVSEAVTIKLTVDGVIIWNSVPTNGTTQHLFGAEVNSTGTQQITENMQCNESLLLEINTTSDTSVGLTYLVRPLA